ncbi:MAG TPA: TonB family protein [Pseudomonadales bacterium]|nr:TonB family protein [Pseudomonadales bacterium]
MTRHATLLLCTVAAALAFAPAGSDAREAAVQAPEADESRGAPADPLAAGAAFLAANARRSDVVTLRSGLQYRSITEGTGAHPLPGAGVTVHYTGTLIDGTVFDDSRARGAPARFRMDGVIAGFAEALALMREGDRWELFIPPGLAYGEAGTAGSIPPNSTLVFDLELISTGPDLYNVVGSMPAFPGCDTPERSETERQRCTDDRLLEFVDARLEYPPQARANGVEGTVIARFVVERDGTLSDARIVRDIGAGCGAEVLRILTALRTEGGAWTPGVERGRPVRVQKTVPIRFSLD